VLLAFDLAATIIVVISTVLVVVVVLGLHVWGAIQDGRDERAMRAWRHRWRRRA
jgi:type IV secretory pathway VirB3-like protein